MCADLLSRPQPRPEEINKPHTDDNNLEPDINNNAFEISTINSNKFNSKQFANCNVEDSDLPTKDDLSFKNFDTTVEQDQDKEIAEIKDQLLHGKENKKVQNKFILIDNIVNYTSNPDNEATVRVYIPKHLKEAVVKEYHDNLHMGIEKNIRFHSSKIVLA